MEITPAAAAKQLRDSTDKEGLLNQFVRIPSNGSILSHLATNPDTKNDMVVWLQPRLAEVFPLLREISDPKFMAMGLLAAANTKMRPLLLDMAAENLPETPAVLNILLRVSMKTKLDGARFASLVAPLCDRRLDYEVCSLASVVLSCCMPEGLDALNKWCETQISSNDKEGVITAFSAVAAICSLSPGSSSALFQQPWILNPPITGQLYADEQVTLACLEMLSAVCWSKDVRQSVEQHFGKFINNACDSYRENVKLVAASVRVKLMAGGSKPEDFKSLSSDSTKAEELSVLFENYVESGNNEAFEPRYLGVALEGLAVTSHISSVRLRAGQNLVNKLVTHIKEGKDASWVYCSLSCLANLAQYPFKDTNDQAQARALKMKSSEATFLDAQLALTPEQAAGITDMIIESKLVSWLGEGCSRLSLKSLEQVALLLRSLASSNVKARRTKLANQGIVVVSIYLWLNNDEKRKLDEQHKCFAGEAIAKTLASVPPLLAFNDRFPPALAVGPLKAQIYNPVSERKNLDTYESLLALTNIASVDDDRARNTITIKCWPKLEETVTSEFAMIQQASIELICNLAPCEACAHMFSLPGEKSKFMTSVLGKCLELEYRNGRLAAAGAIAMLLQWEGLPEVLGHNREIVCGLIKALDRSDDPEMMLRVLTSFDTFISDSELREDVEVPETIIHEGGMAQLEQVIEEVDPNEQEVTNLIVKILQKLAKCKLREDRYTRTDYIKEGPATSLME